MSQLKRRLLLLGLALIATTYGGWTYHVHQKYKRVLTHEKGRLYRSAWVEPDVISELVDKYRLRTVVNLCNPGEMGEDRWVAERAAVFNAGAKLIELPMPVSVDPNVDGIDDHLEIMSNPDNYPMLVHCQHGFTRTAKFLTMYDIAFRNMSAKQAVEQQPLFSYEQMDVHVSTFAKEFEKKHLTAYPNVDRQKLQILSQ